MYYVTNDCNLQKQCGLAEEFLERDFFDHRVRKLLEIFRDNFYITLEESGPKTTFKSAAEGYPTLPLKTLVDQITAFIEKHSAAPAAAAKPANDGGMA